MADENSTPEERTEAPSERRLEQLRKEGAMHFSNDVVMVLGLMTGFFMLYLTWGWLYSELCEVLVKCLKQISSTEPLTVQLAYSGTLSGLYMFVPPIALLAGAISLVTGLSVMLQTNWTVKEKKINFQFSALNPIAGLKKIISINSLVNTLKQIVKLLIILPIAYYGLKGYAADMVQLIHMNVFTVLKFTSEGVWDLFWKILYVLICMAAFDYFWSKHRWLKQNRMTKQEVKEERKSIEGDESSKRRMQMKGLNRIAQRIKQSVPQADVVVTNPTHYAVALKYDRENMDAPIVVAKGRGFMALRIREIAKEAGVPVMERKWLARSLYASVEIGSQIPLDLFKAVAEVLAYVYRLKGRVRPQVQRQ